MQTAGKTINDQIIQNSNSCYSWWHGLHNKRNLQKSHSLEIVIDYKLHRFNVGHSF